MVQKPLKIDMARPTGFSTSSSASVPCLAAETIPRAPPIARRDADGGKSTQVTKQKRLRIDRAALDRQIRLALFKFDDMAGVLRKIVDAAHYEGDVTLSTQKGTKGKITRRGSRGRRRRGADGKFVSRDTHEGKEPCLKADFDNHEKTKEKFVAVVQATEKVGWRTKVKRAETRARAAEKENKELKKERNALLAEEEEDGKAQERRAEQNGDLANRELALLLSKKFYDMERSKNESLMKEREAEVEMRTRVLEEAAAPTENAELHQRLQTVMKAQLEGRVRMEKEAAELRRQIADLKRELQGPEMGRVAPVYVPMQQKPIRLSKEEPPRRPDGKFKYSGSSLKWDPVTKWIIRGPDGTPVLH